MPDASTSFDRQMMAIALAMARRGLGRTAPNPSVGAVIADETTGEVIARGWTQPGGRPHAETQAIARAGERTRGATIYVTLEPCSHHGKTPPCADAIIAAGFKRAVVGTLDPDPRVSGRGMRMLRAAGIEVTRGVLVDEAHRMARGHILRVTERRPLVQLKMALDADGHVPQGANGQPVWVTGPDARAHGHILRAKADAILVGSGTVRDDDPELTCRLPGLSARSPIRVVLAGTELPSPTAKLVRTAREIPVWLFAGEARKLASLPQLVEAGVRCFDVASVDGRPWLPAVLEALVAEGITRLLVEGGAGIWRAFLSQRLADEVYLYQPLAGGDAVARARTALQSFEPAGANSQFTLANVRDVGPDRVHVFRRT